MNTYEVHNGFRQRWAFEVRINGRTLARCDTKRDAENVAKAMNMAIAVSHAAAIEVRQERL